MTNMICNHIALRIAGTDDLLINLCGLLYKEIAASSLVGIDGEAHIRWKPVSNYGINKFGYVIHGALHRRARAWRRWSTPIPARAWACPRWPAACFGSIRRPSALWAISVCRGHKGLQSTWPNVSGWFATSDRMML
jgi:hypothetical protein